ncbi:hypothetical protein [Mameliella alba]|uniref:Uncharacterized protein n=1 Tax=Mameliella alba TaxID=561184 RepID=A0A0B3S7D3_9RHOB|nr:hypothetical protein [Mameliella alba]KHQ52586.1 hypothetical protein OA50_02619 [Mameliella alba]
MTKRTRPRGTTIVAGVFGLLVLTIVTAMIGAALASWLIPGDSGRDGQLGFVLLLPVLWLWKKFLEYCGIVFPGPDGDGK